MSILKNDTVDENGRVTKHQIVLERRATVDQRPMDQLSYAFFQIPPEDQASGLPSQGFIHVKYEMDIETWEEMARPDRITVTVEAGAKLE